MMVLEVFELSIQAGLRKVGNGQLTKKEAGCFIRDEESTLEDTYKWAEIRHIHGNGSSFMGCR